MNAHRKGIQLSAEEQVEIFGTTAFSQEYAAEAEERWGDTDAWKQSRQRVAGYTQDDWVQIKADGDALLHALAEAKRAGVEPGSAEANELAARHRASIERFYNCGDEIAPQPGGDVSGRRTVHPVLRRRRAGPRAVPPRHRRG